MAKTPTKFERGTNRGNKRCISCGKNTWESRIDMSSELCTVATGDQIVSCYDAAGLENEHVDGVHSVDQNGPEATCPMCTAEAVKKASEAPKAKAPKKAKVEPKPEPKAVEVERPFKKADAVDPKSPWTDAEREELKQICRHYGPYQGTKEFAELHPGRTAPGAMYQWAKIQKQAAI